MKNNLMNRMVLQKDITAKNSFLTRALPILLCLFGAIVIWLAVQAALQV